ncbi:MAG: phosphoenolpyruvate--protein phosphotransferase [Pseudomonadota bacterium]|nr:phosphoenolpyruvate--protein phosphotransferase [Pseudomonadota bacterium]
MLALYGTGIGSGIAIGSARVINRADREVPDYSLAPEQVAEEVLRFQAAIAAARDKLIQVKADLPADTPEEVGSFVDAHLLMLEDPTISRAPIETVRGELRNAESALQQHAGELARVFEAIEDPYLRSKQTDVAQVVNRVQQELLGEPDDISNQLSGDLDGQIVVSNDLTPADTVSLKRHRLGAFVTNLGGPISHTAILTRSMRIPAIVGLHGAIRFLRTGDLLVIDGKRGVVLVNPDPAVLSEYQRRREKIVRRAQELDALGGVESVTLDNITVTLQANIELPEDIEQHEIGYAEGVGLYRTEFLYMNRSEPPDEEEQYQAYAHVLQRMNRPVTIRTLDLGADKQVDGGRGGHNNATNPALGLRAIRLCLKDPALFRPQLRAIYRASAHGPVRIMVPMVSSLDEMEQLYCLIADVKSDLKREGHAFNPHLPIGGMVEVPAAAIAADLFAERFDFLSIGTNDLIQYTLAIDRVDDEVNYLYDPLHPAVLRLIRGIIQAGRKANIPVSMCGEMAGDQGYTRLLLGMGLRDFSMDAVALLEIKRQVRISDISQLEKQTVAILETASPQRLRELVRQMG